MTRDLIKFTPEEAKKIVVFKDGTLTTIVSPLDTGAAVSNLKPSDVVDFIVLPDKRVILVISDTFIEDPNALVKDAHFLPLDQIPVETASWALPLSLPAILARSLGNDDDAWTVLEQLAGRYLELGAWSDQTKPWKDGLVAATIRGNWDVWKERGLVEGESYWGWIKGRYYISNGGEGWPSVKSRFEGWMRAADVFLRNVENQEWIAELTLNHILEVPISKAIRCCGAIGEGLFSYSGELRKALFNPEISNEDMNHLIAVAKAHKDEIPERVVNEETGEIEYIVPATGEKAEELDTDVLDQFLPPIDGEEIAISRTPPEGTFWTYNYEIQMFGYWEAGSWIPALSVQTDNQTVMRFVDRIIAACGVAAEYD